MLLKTVIEAMNIIFTNGLTQGPIYFNKTKRIGYYLNGFRHENKIFKGDMNGYSKNTGYYFRNDKYIK